MGKVLKFKIGDEDSIHEQTIDEVVRNANDELAGIAKKYSQLLAQAAEIQTQIDRLRETHTTASIAGLRIPDFHNNPEIIHLTNQIEEKTREIKGIIEEIDSLLTDARKIREVTHRTISQIVMFDPAV